MIYAFSREKELIKLSRSKLVIFVLEKDNKSDSPISMEIISETCERQAIGPGHTETGLNKHPEPMCWDVEVSAKG